LLGSACTPDAHLAVEDRPADVVPQPLVVEYELADRLRELVALPPALESPCALALSIQRGGACGLDRIGGRTQLVRRHVCDDRRLAGGVRGMAWRPPRSLAAAIAWPPAERASVMEISPRAQARPSSIARRGRGSSGRADSKRSSTCSAHDAAHKARRW